MPSGDDGSWPNPVLPYVMTGGRTRPSRNTLGPETLLHTTAAGVTRGHTNAEMAELLHQCHWSQSLAEAAAHLQLSISVVQVLASDLLDDGLLTVKSATRDTRPDQALLERVLHGLRNL
jgi:hypothetical protein